MINYIKKTYRGNKESFFKVLENNLVNNNKMFIVTANPETFMKEIGRASCRERV